MRANEVRCVQDLCVRDTSDGSSEGVHDDLRTAEVDETAVTRVHCDHLVLGDVAGDSGLHGCSNSSHDGLLGSSKQLGRKILSQSEPLGDTIQPCAVQTLQWPGKRRLLVVGCGKAEVNRNHDRRQQPLSFQPQ